MAKAEKSISRQSVQHEVLEALNSGFDAPPSVLQLCDDAEARLLELSVMIAKRQLLSKTRQPEAGEIANDVVVLGTRQYQIAIHASSTGSDRPPDLLHLQILPMLARDPKGEKPIFKTSSRVYGLGRYRAVTVSVPHNLAAEGERLAQAVSFALETGYAWLAEKISLILSETRDTAVDSLYSHIRTLLPHHAHLICLFLFREEKGIYIHDALATRAWMQRAGKRSVRSTHSPIELVSQFTTQVVDFQESFSRFIHAEKKTRNFPLARAGYAHSGLQIAEMAIYEDEAFVAHPLVTEKEFLLTAGYPVALRAQIEMILSAEKPKFRDILLNARKELARLHQRIEAMRLIGKGGDRTATWAGTFFGTSLATYEKIKGG